MRRRRQNTTPQYSAPEISLTPLIDTVLVLLVTFMIAMPVMQNMLSIELPSGSANDENTTQGAKGAAGISVYLDCDRKLFVNEQQIAWPLLIKEIERRLGNARDQVVYVKADRHVPYGEVVRIIDDIKYLGGVRYVALSTEHE